MDRQEIWAAAMAQSAIDLGCAAGDFERPENVVVASRPSPGARRYLELPFLCSLVSYGSNVVASVDPRYGPVVRRYLDKYDVSHCFETPNLHVLDDAFAPHGARVCFMAEYFLPDPDALTALPCAFETRPMGPSDFAALYGETWSNALCEKRKELDVLGVGAYDGDTLIGLAACSADCETMWQIGVDVLGAYRRRGVASALTSRLALEILARDKVPFYCSAWCNLKSVRNALKSGFKPAWAELTVKSRELVDAMNA